MFRWLQNFPHFLEIIYNLFEYGLNPFKRWFNPGGKGEPLIIAVEKPAKVLFSTAKCAANAFCTAPG